MKKIIFENKLHQKKYESLLKRIPEKDRSPENISVVYLIAWVETIRPGTADQIFDFHNFLINIYVYPRLWQTRMTQNAIFLADSLKKNNYGTALNIIEASDCHKCFLEALYIRYDICYADVEEQLKEIAIQYKNKKRNGN
jgi:hypothetical protein